MSQGLAVGCHKGFVVVSVCASSKPGGCGLLGLSGFLSHCVLIMSAC